MRTLDLSVPVKTHQQTSENADQYEEDLEVLAAVGQLLATQSGQQQMLTAVLDELEAELGMIRGTIMLLSSDGSELFVEVARDVPQGEGKGLRYRRGEGIVGGVVQTGQAAIIPRISQEPRFTDRIHKRHKADKADGSFLCVPIAVGSEVVGTLSVDLPVQQFSQLLGRSRLLGIVASMIAYDVKSRRIEALQRQHLEAESAATQCAAGTVPAGKYHRQLEHHARGVSQNPSGGRQ
jgi:Nif-specific regulatory protein